HDWIVRKCQIPAVVSDIMVRPYQATLPPPSPPSEPAKSKEKAARKGTAQKSKTPAAKTAGGTEPASALANVGISSEGLVPEKPRATEPHLSAASKTVPAAELADSILRVDAERIDNVMNLVGELIIGKSMMHQTMNEFDKRFPKDALRNRFVDVMAFQSRVLTDLQKSVMKIRMVPVEQLFRRFPRLVRDVAKARGREVQLDLSGEDTDLDKSILDILGEPLTHLIRNAVDHGIESPAERTATGKPAQGTIHLKAYHQGNQVVIEVSDDGHGIDRKKVIAKAIERKIIAANDAARLSEQEALNLIFHPGLSTAEEVTAISGRGVGMDVVKTIVERLKGSVHIET